MKKKARSSSRPTGRLDPTPADLASGSLALAALASQARRGEIMLLYEDETILWRFALPRAGWWRQARRARLPTRPLSQSQSKRAEALTRQAWGPYRSWSRVTRGGGAASWAPSSMGPPQSGLCWLTLSGTLSQQTLFLQYATKIISVV
jgi:hypothetical protein